MTAFNKVILIGNLVRDPEVRYTPNTTTAVASFSMAVNSKVKQGDAYKDKVDYFDVVTFGRQAENIGKYVFKGDLILIEGRLNQRRWEDKESGQKRSKIEVQAQTVTFMPKRTGASQGSEYVPPNVAGSFPNAEPVGDEEIPF